MVKKVETKLDTKDISNKNINTLSNSNKSNGERCINIYQKLQRCRVGLQKRAMKKSGKNTFSNYEYFELGDFLPQINELMDEHNLTAIFQYSPEIATLTIIDTEKIEDKIVFSTPVEVTQLKGCNGMQNIGGTQTFSRRYLYTMAFEIAENDLVNKSEVDEEAEFKRKKIDEIKVVTIKEMLNKTSSNEEIFLKYYKIKKVEDITNEFFPRIMKTLQDKLDKTEKENKAKSLDLGI